MDAKDVFRRVCIGLGQVNATFHQRTRTYIHLLVPQSYSYDRSGTRENWPPLGVRVYSVAGRDLLTALTQKSVRSVW